MRANNRQLRDILLRSLKQAPEGGKRAIITRFVAELARQGSSDVLSSVIAELESGREGNVLEVHVAHGMTISGADVHVEPELIAGGRLRRGDIIADASVQGRLHTLRNKLAPNR